MMSRPFPLNHQPKRPIHDSLSQVILIAVLLAVFVGCSSIGTGLSRDKPEPPDAAARAEAQAVLATLNSYNAGLKNFKGIG